MMMSHEPMKSVPTFFNPYQAGFISLTANFFSSQFSAAAHEVFPLAYDNGNRFSEASIRRSSNVAMINAGIPESERAAMHNRALVNKATKEYDVSTMERTLEIKIQPLAQGQSFITLEFHNF